MGHGALALISAGFVHNGHPSVPFIQNITYENAQLIADWLAASTQARIELRFLSLTKETRIITRDRRLES